MLKICFFGNKIKNDVYSIAIFSCLRSFLFQLFHYLTSSQENEIDYPKNTQSRHYTI